MQRPNSTGGVAVEEKEVDAWEEFLNNYAQGRYLTGVPPHPSRFASHSHGPLSPVHVPSSVRYCDLDPNVVVSCSSKESSLEGEAHVPPEHNDEIQPPWADLTLSFEKPLYPSVDIDRETARFIRDFYHTHGFLPPPRSPLETLRERFVQEYDLYNPSQIANFESAVHLAHSFFGGVCTFTLFRDNVQVFTAVKADPGQLEAIGLEPRMRVMPETSFCGHAVLVAEKMNAEAAAGGNVITDMNYVIDVKNLVDDWRYKGNPFCKGDVSFHSYIGAVVSLSLDPMTEGSHPVTVPIGVLNVMSANPRSSQLSEHEHTTLQHIARMLQTCLRATWEGTGRTREAKARNALSEMIEKTLVNTDRRELGEMVAVNGEAVRRASADAGYAKLAAASGEVDKQIIEDGGGPAPERDHPLMGLRLPSGLLQPRSDSGSTDRTDVSHSVADAVDLLSSQIKSVISSAEDVYVLDLREIHPTRSPEGGALFACEEGIPVELPLLNRAPAQNLRQRFDTFGLIRFLSTYALQPNREMAFDRDKQLSGLEGYLAAATEAHIVMPFFIAGKEPLFAVIVTSSTQFRQFIPAEIKFVKSMGVVLRALLMQSRVLEADAAKTAFLSSISHELRTPLHGLILGLQLIADAVNAGDQVNAKKNLEVAELSGHVLQQILNDVLDFGQIEAGTSRKEPSQAEEVDLVELMASAAVSTLSNFQGPKVEGDEGVAVKLEYENIPWKVAVDAAGIQRVIVNALSNALKHTSRGCVTITVTANEARDACIISVRDTGSGIAPEFMPHIFEPFRKADELVVGVGLGLYITKHLIEKQMKGQVVLESIVGRGTVFKAVIPVSLSATTRGQMITRAIDYPWSRPSGVETPAEGNLLDAVATQLAKSSVAESISIPSDPLRVLVVDDNLIVMKLMTAILQKKQAVPCLIATAENGVLAVEQFEAFQPHLVCTDVSMPKMSGIEAATRMRKIEQEKGWRPAKIFAMTGLGSSDPRLKVDALKGEACLDGWLIKGKDRLDSITKIVVEAEAARLALAG